MWIKALRGLAFPGGIALQSQMDGGLIISRNGQ